MNDAAFDALVALAYAQGVAVRELDAALGPVHDLSQNELLLLRALAAARGGRARPVDLSRALQLTASGITRAIDPLERRGLVRRERDPRDKRATGVVLTDEGAALLGIGIVTATEVAERLMRRLSVGQSRQLERLLSEIAPG